MCIVYIFGFDEWIEVNYDFKTMKNLFDSINNDDWFFENRILTIAL